MFTFYDKGSLLHHPMLSQTPGPNAPPDAGITDAPTTQSKAYFCDAAEIREKNK